MGRWPTGRRDILRGGRGGGNATVSSMQGLPECLRAAVLATPFLFGTVLYPAAAQATQSYTLAPLAQDFGDQTLFTKRTRSFGLRNTGTAPLDLGSVAVGGLHATLFSATHNCGSVVAVGATCKVHVSFRPDTVGAKSAWLRVVAGGNLALTRDLAGTGVLAEFSTSPASLAFGDITVDSASAPRDVVVTNTGAGVLPIKSIKLGGANPGQFALTHDCPYSVVVGGRCTVRVTFEPTLAGDKYAAVVVTPGGGAAPQSVTLGGTGAGAASGLPTATDSSESAYVVPTASGWSVVPLLTVGDKPAGSTYAMVGKPDGLGALAGRISASGELLEPGQYFTVFMNHELASTRGVVRAHGAAGSFVSQWTVDLDSLRIVGGRDLVTRTFAYGSGGWTDATGTLAFDRLCSADLPAAAALFNASSGNGFNGRLFLNGEEAGTEGRAFAHVVTGNAYGASYELPHLGKFSHENVVAHPDSGDTTLVVSLDDSSPGQVYVYVGRKRATGNPVERAGLSGGRLYGIRVVDGGARYPGAVPRENNGPIRGRFELVDVSAYATGSGTNLQSASVGLGITEFARPEDGHWDSVDAASFYWATTGANVDGAWQTARLYRLTFDSLEQPTGGTIELVVDSATLTGTDGIKARGFDNVTVDSAGRVVVQEDGGDNAYIAKTWLIDPARGTRVQVVESDRNRFTPGAPGFLTRAEENSGVIEVTELVRSASWYQAGRRYYLGTNQAHYSLPGALVEGGQWYLLASPP